MSPRRSSGPPSAESEGRYRMRGRFSVGVLGAYGVILALILLVVSSNHAIAPWAIYLLIGITGFFLARYLTVRYVLDDAALVSWALFFRHRTPLEEVRAIEYANLRDLAPVGGWLGSWSWRGKMFSPTIGDFELVYTEASHGLLITAGAFPLYISPRDPDAFARELSRRVRSYTGPLLKDVGGTLPEPV